METIPSWVGAGGAISVTVFAVIYVLQQLVRFQKGFLDPAYARMAELEDDVERLERRHTTDMKYLRAAERREATLLLFIHSQGLKPPVDYTDPEVLGYEQ